MNYTLLKKHREIRSLNFAAMDSFILKQFPTGNLFIEFKEFNHKIHGSKIFELYYRSVYTLLPRKVYVVPENIDILDSETILKHNHLPKNDWLKTRGISAILTFEIVNGKFRQRIKRVQ